MDASSKMSLVEDKSLFQKLNSSFKIFGLLTEYTKVEMSIYMVRLWNCNSSLVILFGIFKFVSSLFNNASITDKSIDVFRFIFENYIEKTLGFF
jgi:hypothetical protein